MTPAKTTTLLALVDSTDVVARALPRARQRAN